MVLVGVDVGGTFTDFVFVDEEGRVVVRKRPSTPRDPSESILAGLREAQAEGLLPTGFAVVHGTTVATNALLERKGARAALLTTQGFRDVLEIGRGHRENLYTFNPTKPVPLLERELRREVLERVDWTGAILTPLDEAEVARVLEELVAQGIESLAICFLFSYLNPIHEQRAGELARQQGLFVSLSSEVAPEPREYERTSTTVANAFVAPLMTQYLNRLETGLRERGANRLRIMQSNGGALSALEAGRRAVMTALSGPAGGIVAGVQIGREAGFSHLLTFDMGGTSTDVALVVDGECAVSMTTQIGGMPLRTPLLDIHTVGAGGGSLARLDAAGGLKVGPESAGAEPGPVAYGRGEGLTVTDANVLLGRLPADVRLAGQVPLDGERVRAYFAPFARALHCSPEKAALGILRVVNAAMSRALRHISLERGQDPAECTLLSFGGAGGLHACALADALQMRSILVPRFPGAFSALGLALADVKREYAHSLPVSPEPTDWTRTAVRKGLMRRFASLEAQAKHDLKQEGFGEGAWNSERILNLRYVGQSFDLRVPLLDDDLPAAIARFHELHRARYGHADAGEPVEAVAVRVIATGRETRPQFAPILPASPGKPTGEVSLYFESGWVSAPVYARDTLAAGQSFSGPALILQSDATTLLEPCWKAQVDKQGNLIFNRE